jgi:ATP-dependent DNA ligase
LLGLFRADGGIDYVGSAAVAASRHAHIAEEVFPLLEEMQKGRVSEPNRWGGSGLEEQPVRPELVAEVRYDKVQGQRFRHGTKLLRLRPDKDPRSCTWEELRAPPDPTVPTIGALLDR